jgi:putative ATP-dependent endonuclease of OLD family
MTAPTIRKLEIKGFRTIQSLVWSPHSRLNVILGAADAGKSTILEALALLFSTSPSQGLSEFDYHLRDLRSGFSIEAVLAIGDEGLLHDEGFPAPPMQGWLAGKVTDLPDEDGAEPVIVCRVAGTPDQETLYEIIGAGGEIRVPFSRAMRRRVGLARLGIADRSDRDIRLVQGGALDRFLQGQDIRQTVMQAVMKTPVHDQLDKGPKSALDKISEGFKTRNLPHPVRLGLVGTPGVSLAASVGLTVGTSDAEALPLTAWGTGTRRLAALEIATLGISAESIAVIDEPETGLEPYRQRVFVRDLAAGARQAFVTTHAPAVLSQAAKAVGMIWRMSHPFTSANEPPENGELDHKPDSHVLVSASGTELTSIAETQPEALFAKMPLVCEGITEVGFVTRLLEHKFGVGFSCRGIFCLDASGHYNALPICKALIASGFAVAGLVDDEGKKGGAWAEVANSAILLRWKDGACLESAALSALPDDLLPQVHIWVDQTSHRNAVHQLAEIRQALDLEKGLSAEQMFEQAGRDRYLSAVIARACPKPDGDRKPRGWFKTFEGGYLLAGKLLSVKPRPSLMETIEIFLTAIDRATAP